MDVFGREIIELEVSQTLTNINVQSYYYNGQLIEEFERVYLKFEKWISLFFDSGVLFIKEENDEKLQKIEFEGNIVEYKYLDILKIGGLSSIVGKKLKKLSMLEDRQIKLEFEEEKILLFANNMDTNGNFIGSFLIVM